MTAIQLATRRGSSQHNSCHGGAQPASCGRGQLTPRPSLRVLRTSPDWGPEREFKTVFQARRALDDSNSRLSIISFQGDGH